MLAEFCSGKKDEDSCSVSSGSGPSVRRSEWFWFISKFNGGKAEMPR